MWLGSSGPPAVNNPSSSFLAYSLTNVLPRLTAYPVLISALEVFARACARTSFSSRSVAPTSITPSACKGMTVGSEFFFSNSTYVYLYINLRSTFDISSVCMFSSMPITPDSFTSVLVSAV
jgi:hypothetical protein